MTSEILDIIKSVAVSFKLDPNVAIAIAGHETNYIPEKTRYEPNWEYFVTPYVFAKHLGITMETERILQAISWGPMQIMGSVAREMGYHNHLPLLIDPKLGTFYACKKLKSLYDMYHDEPSIFASYNAGVPKKLNGVYTNQPYVTDILDRLRKLRGG